MTKREWDRLHSETQKRINELDKVVKEIVDENRKASYPMNKKRRKK